MTQIEVQEYFLKRATKQNLIFYAVYGFWKLYKLKGEPKLVREKIDCGTLENSLEVLFVNFIKINNTEYPMLNDAESTLLNIIRKQKGRLEKK